MGEIKTTADQVLRDFSSDGVASSGIFEPAKSDLRALFGKIDIAIYAAQAGMAIVADLAARDAYFADAGNQGKLVYVNDNNGDSGDPDNGVYEYVDGAPRLASGFYQGVAAVVQPLVDEVIVAVGQVSDIAAKQVSDVPTIALTDEAGNGGMVIYPDKIDHPDANQMRASAATAGGSIIRQAGANRVALTDEAGNACAVFDISGSTSDAAGSPSSTYAIEPAVFSYGESEAYSRDQLLGATAYLFIVFGQSNAIGTNNDVDALISSEATYPDNALRLGASPRVTAGGNSLEPLEEVTSGVLKETAVSALVNHFIREHDSVFGAMPTVVGFAAGTGGAPMMALKRGSDAYENFLAGVDDAVAGLRLRGFRKIVTVVNWIGSESDADKFYGMHAGWWKTMAQAFFRGLQQDVMERTGETLPPLVVLQPISYNPDALNGAVPLPAGGTAVLDLWDAPVLRGMLSLDGVDNIRVAPPAYAYPHSTAGGDALHRNNTGHYWCGLNLAKVAWAELIGTGWRGCRPSRTDRPYFATATQIIIPFETQGGGPEVGGGIDASALVLDASEDYVAAIADHGLQFDDGSGAPPAITGVSVDGRNLVVDLAAAPAGPRCRVAGGITPSTPDAIGPVQGPRMTIRDQHGWTPIHDAAGIIPVYDFAVPFVLEI